MEKAEKRSGKRCANKALVQITCLNKDDGWDALMLNFSNEGMCFRSKTPFTQKMGLLIRVDGRAWSDTRPEFDNGLRHMTIGEVKWCKKIDDDAGPFFMTGVKYFPPRY